MVEDIRTLTAAVVSGVLGFLSPIAGDIYTMIIIFIANFLAGYLAGRICNKEDFNFKKAWRCIVEATMFFGLSTCVYAIGYLKGTMTGATQCISTVVYAVLYFYSVNILRNLKAVLRDGTPAYRVVSLLYYILSFEIVKNVPVLGNYLTQEEVNENEG